jgi:hypothetical protein
MNIQGTEIKVGRPKAYNPTMSAIGLMTGAAGPMLGMKGGMYHALDDNTT